MKINLAGYNIETDLINKFASTQSPHWTPEIFSAAYARISRSTKDITSLRQEARNDVAKARQSNKSIIFEMGHHSVAEHAIFNFDIMDVSRLALEEIERFRLASYTEKSQRYVTLKGDFITPRELTDESLLTLFQQTIQVQNQFYQKAFDTIQNNLCKQSPDIAGNKYGKSLLTNQAKEDARYVLSLATAGQVGMTINARNLEHLFRRFTMNPRQEIRDIGRRLFDLIMPIAPSLILFSEPSQFEKSYPEVLKFHLNSISTPYPCCQEFQLLDYTREGDAVILATFLSLYNRCDFEEALKIIRALDREKITFMYKDLFSHIEFFDVPPREFELADVTFQAVISASNYAQLKRHRMATILLGDYQIDLGNTVPDSFSQNGLEKEFRDIIDQTNQAFLKIRDHSPQAADYILTNSHRRQIIMKMNLREAYHFARLRDDQHAQWDIRNLARLLTEKLIEIFPAAAMLLCGKSQFVGHFEKIFHKKPAITTW